ncbi:MAG: DUF547 domain-containing protein [Deltaproteobacteria bacterium]|nr:DUF547 domain-containing protein [Deltaproteobacteria bacterium]
MDFRTREGRMEALVLRNSRPAWIMLLVLLLLFCMAIKSAGAIPLPNEAWGKLLAGFVHEGRVDYDGIEAHPALLQQSLKEFSRITRRVYDKWSREQQLAHWINAYNLFTVKAVVDHYPPKGWNFLYPRISIRQISRVWDRKEYRTAGERLSLNRIEHQILRPLFREPRVHFALVCASLGCPPLPAQPYTGENLEVMLNRQVRIYLDDTDHGLHWDPATRTLSLSQIFSWFGEDFRGYTERHRLFRALPAKQRNALNFVWEYLPERIRKSLTAEPFRIHYMKYDWSLNGRP